MKTKSLFKIMMLPALALLAVSISSPAQEMITDAIDTVRQIYQVDRKLFVAEKLSLTDTEAAGFWSLYAKYRADVDKIGDDLVKLVLEYGDVYPDVPEDQARSLLKQFTSLEEKLVKRRTYYLKKAGKILPAAKVLRWAQLENRMDLLLRLQLAGRIPLVPEK